MLGEDVTNALHMTLTPFPNTIQTPFLTCVGDSQPPSQEVEGPVGGVCYVARQRLKVALSRQPAHELRGVRVEFAVVQGVRAVGERVQQGPVGHGELPGGVVARAEGALVTGGGGGQVGLDGEQVGVLCFNEKQRRRAPG